MKIDGFADLEFREQSGCKSFGSVATPFSHYIELAEPKTCVQLKYHSKISLKGALAEFLGSLQRARAFKNRQITSRFGFLAFWLFGFFFGFVGWLVRRNRIAATAQHSGRK